MPAETQKSISAWAEATFGPAQDLGVLVERARIELDELLEAVQNQNREEIGKETADIAILLMRLLEQHSLDFHSELDSKMAINRQRNWKPYQGIALALDFGHTFNLHARPKRKTTCPQRTSRGKTLGKIGAIHFIHCSPFRHVSKHYKALHNLVHA